MTVLAVCALGACTGDEPGDPRTFPPYTAPASPTPTPTPTAPPASDAATPPERPDMSTVDAETAEAVATYFLQLYPYVFASGDLTEWDALSHPECVYCSEVHAGVEELAASGDLSPGGLVEISSVVSSETTPGSWWLVQIGMRQTSTSAEEPGVAYDTAVVVVREADTWLIRAVEPTRQS